VTRRETVKAVLHHEETDVVPYSLGFTKAAARKLSEYFGTDDFDDKIGNYIATVVAKSSDSWQEVEPGYWQDEFGVVWDRTIDVDIGMPHSYILQDMQLDEYTLPDSLDPRRYSHLTEECRQQRDKFILCAFGFSLFERAWSLRGMEQLLVDMIQDPGYVDALLDRILEYNLEIIGEVVKYDIDGIQFGDDWGQQHGLIMGPKLWRRFIKPRVAKMYKKLKDAGKSVFIHSCGDIKEIFDDIIELEVDAFRPFQPEVLDVYEMKAKYGDRMTFYGGISTQITLPFGTPEQVRLEIQRLRSRLSHNGGYILAPAHYVPGDVPLSNLLALIEEVCEK
jgi:uroporphyrinogen decarboxylase